MGLTEQYALYKDEAFKQKVLMAMGKAALAVVGEPPSVNPARTDKRHRLALSVLENPEGRLERFALSVAIDSTITVDSLDPDINTAVAAAWDKVAGVADADTKVAMILSEAARA